MRSMRIALTILVVLSAVSGFSQNNLSVKWEELTAPDFVKAIEQAKGTCLLPTGIVEKHGTHLPLGTDLINVRYASVEGAKQEYAVVFPEFFFGQIFEAQQQPGTISYSASLTTQVLQETVAEMSRNGCKKILIVNGHGGNNSYLPYFAQSQLASPRDYAVFIFALPNLEIPGRPAFSDPFGMHGGVTESSHMMISRPDLLKLDRAGQESGVDLNRLKLPESVYTAIWWYAKFPHHYAGDASTANKALGEFDMKAWSTQIAEAIRAIKADTATLQLQNEFFEKTKNPLATKQ